MSAARHHPGSPAPQGCGRLARLRMRACPDERGQTMPVVLGVILLLSLGSIMLVQNTFEQFPIVTKDVIQHEAYRAMVAGLNEYEYSVNANGDIAACDAEFVNSSGTVVGSTSSSLNSSSICSGLSFGTWTSVPGTASSNGAPAWFQLDDPEINTSTGNLSINVMGVAGYANDYNYQTAVVTLQPLNSFLLNVLWMNYDQIIPAVVKQYSSNFGGANPSSCAYYWPSNSLSTGCQRLDFITPDSLSGNVFVNDSVFLCGAPTFKNLQTADTNQQWVQDNGCTGTPTVTGTKAFGVAKQSIPSDNGSLLEDAEQNGCVYQGPTQITLNGSTMTVSSPATPTGAPTNAPNGSSSNDALNDPANTANQCMPTVANPNPAVPANGVIYVSNCESSPVNYVTTSGGTTYCNGQTSNPLANAGETGTGGDTAGDAIVQGTVGQPMTIGSGNNIIIDGNLCNTDTLSGGNCQTTTPATPSADVLGLVATNYVEINHPVSGGNDAATCSSTPGAGTVNCDLSNPVIDAVVLALGGSFLVNNYTTGANLGTINLYGTIDQDWRGPVGTDRSGVLQTGYAKNYQYDPRLTYLSPPYYLNPGTSQWGFAAFTVVSGSCKLAAKSPLTPTSKYCFFP